MCASLQHFSRNWLQSCGNLAEFVKSGRFLASDNNLRKFDKGICILKIEFDIVSSARRATEGWSERQVGNGLAGVRNLRGWKRVRVWERANDGKNSRAGTRESWIGTCVWESASVGKRLRLIEVRPQVAKACRGGKPRASGGKRVGREEGRAQMNCEMDCGGWSEKQIQISASVVKLCCVTFVTQNQVNFERRWS